MNRFFHPEEGRRGFPSRSYARLDDLEPVAQTGEEPLTFTFDAVDADWKGFAEGGPFDVDSPDTSRAIRENWRRRVKRSRSTVPSSPSDFEPSTGDFSGDGGDDGSGPFTSEGPEPYDDIPVYRIEFSLERFHPWFQSIPQSEEGWVVLHLTADETDIPVDVYGGLFAPPTKAYLEAPAVQTGFTPGLDAAFDMDAWPDSTKDEVVAAIGRQVCEIGALVCFDIGQGSASALTCSHGLPLYYYDVGRGSGRNAPTAPSKVDFCTCEQPPVILSHWDTDHWAGAVGHAGLHRRVWVVPRQKISTTHVLLANDILNAGGAILVVPAGTPPMRWTNGSQMFDLQRCTGTSGRNSTGLALVVTDLQSGRAFVLTGDAPYDCIPQQPPFDIAALVAPHHGADMGKKSVPFSRSGQDYSRLIYSFGPGNGHGPKDAAGSPPGPSRCGGPYRGGLASRRLGPATAWPHNSWRRRPGDG